MAQDSELCDRMTTTRTACIVYVANADSGDISVLRADPEGGALGTVQTLAVGKVVMPLAVSPDRRFLYASLRAEPFTAVSLAIAPRDGTLALIGSAPLPASMAFISTDRRGRFLLSASYGADLIAVSPIDADGVVQAAQQVLTTAPKAHAIRADASNRFVFATSLGGGVVMQWRFDAGTGVLTRNAPTQVHAREGAGPRHFAFGTLGALGTSGGPRFLYLLNELDATVDVFALDAEHGTLSPVQTIATLPPGFSGEPWAADIHLTPDGRFLYTSERRASTLAAFRVAADTGRLSIIGHVATEAQPRSFAVSPDGRGLYAVGQLSNRLSRYEIDVNSGELCWVEACAVGRNPNWVEAITLP